jgi:cardiolipin synthase
VGYVVHYFQQKTASKEGNESVHATWQERFHNYSWWEVTIFIIGILSFVTIVVVLFLPLGDGPTKYSVTSQVPSAGSVEFTNFLSETLTLPSNSGDKIKILNNGDEFLESLFQDIDEAKSTINIMLYIWDSGTMSDQIFEHLDAKLKEGVSVRIMLDGYGGLLAKKRKEFRTFMDLGGEVEIYHSLTIMPWNVAHNHKRNHRRAIIIDGAIGYTGGIAVSDKWLGDASNEKEWRDMMFRTTGSMARTIQGSFSELWANTTGELLTGKDFYPENIKPAISSLVYIPLANTPTPDALAIQKFILLSLYGAQAKIYISTPYFLPDAPLRAVLIAKAKEGVDVRVLVPDEHNDSRGVRLASRRSYEELLEGGVKIYEYQPTFIHTKTIVVDGVWSIIGSANLDNRSRTLNEENIIGVSDKLFGKELEDVFFEDVTKSEEITLDQWKKRGIVERVREILALKFVEQY